MKSTSMRIALLTTLLLAACTVGEVGTANNVGGDGGTTDGGSKDPNACVNRLSPADPLHMHAVGGTSNKGQNCIVAACHLASSPGTGAPGFQFAGTVYNTGGATASAGALVRIVSGTTVLMTYTDTDGNFYFTAPALMGTFTANTNVTACPTVTPMTTQLVSGGGGGANSCNLCHTNGTGAQAPPITL